MSAPLPASGVGNVIWASSKRQVWICDLDSEHPIPFITVMGFRPEYSIKASSVIVNVRTVEVLHLGFLPWEDFLYRCEAYVCYSHFNKVTLIKGKQYVEMHRAEKHWDGSLRILTNFWMKSCLHLTFPFQYMHSVKAVLYFLSQLKWDFLQSNSF